MQNRIASVGQKLSSIKSRFFYRPFTHSNGKTLNPILVPELSSDAKIIIPISMTRYEKNKQEYDAELSALFQYTAKKLHQNEIASVDVVATTALHEDWTPSKIAEMDDHFLATHKKILAKQTECFLWHDWINKQGKEKHEAHYNEILALSTDGSEWYNLMVKTHNAALVSEDLEISLRYQRQEYAAIRLMNQYTDIVYMGSISSAWAYLYKLYTDLPRFVRASIKCQHNPMNNFEASFSVKNVIQQIENIVTSPNFPPKEKEKLIEGCISLFHVYEPKKLSVSTEPREQKPSFLLGPMR